MTFRYQGEKGIQSYVIEQPLEKDQQMFVHLDDLVATQKLDQNGHAFSAVATRGTYTLRDLDDPVTGNLFEGRLSPTSATATRIMVA